MKCPEKFRFKHDHFLSEDQMLTTNPEDLANAHLDKIFADAELVHISNPEESNLWSRERLEHHTHQAILLGIQPIEQECKHDCVGWDNSVGYHQCNECGRHLEPNWKVI